MVPLLHSLSWCVDHQNLVRKLVERDMLNAAAYSELLRGQIERFLLRQNLITVLRTHVGVILKSDFLTMIKIFKY